MHTPPLSRRLCLLSGLVCAAVPLWAQTPNAGWRAAVAGLQTRGTHHFRYWGLSIYHAELQVAADFEPARFAQHRLALTMRYSRDFKGQALAQSTWDEMQGLMARGAQRWTSSQSAAWLAQINALMPDVQSGDRLSAVNLPGRGVALFHNEAPLGVVEDRWFADAFLGIWLSPLSPQPAMRQGLLAT
jgi:hypothetical protein